MAVYFVTGSLGSGKGLAALYQLKNYASNGAKIAGNLDIHLDKLIKNPQSKISYTRVPDRPTQNDLLALGSGNDGYDPDSNSLLVLDECVTWLNARNWNDKGRAGLIDWLIHSRKHGWDVILIAQSFETLDKQIVDTLMEYHVSMNNLAKFNIPIIGKLLKGYSSKNRPLKLPQYHFGKVMYKNLVKADSWTFQGKQFYDSYDTKQIFTENNDFASHCLLSNWHLTGRYLPKRIKLNLIKLLFQFLIYTSLRLTGQLKLLPILTYKPSERLSTINPASTITSPLLTIPNRHTVISTVIDGHRIYSI